MRVISPGNGPELYLNRSELINPAVGDGTPDEAEKRWRRWQQRLCQWEQRRHERNRMNTRNGNGRLAPAPDALRSSLPWFHKPVAAKYGNSVGPVLYGNPVGRVLHTAVPGQETGCHLFKNGEGGDSYLVAARVVMEVTTPDLRRVLVLRPPFLHNPLCRAPCRVVTVRTVWITGIGPQKKCEFGAAKLSRV